jgi:metallo-beta-lactamase class B
MSLPLPTLVTLLAAFVADPPHECEPCEEWNRPLAAFRVHGDTWYVGTAGVSAVLITSRDGHILIDGGLPQSAPLIVENIRKAGFRLEDVRIILNSHTHYDHAGGIASLQRASGAQVLASPPSRRALERGGPTEDDPQFAFGPAHNDFPAVPRVRTIQDGETVRVGKTAVTAVFTPGHTAGGTSWTWRSCVGTDCAQIVYADSLNAVSAPGFRFDEPSRLAEFRRSIERIAGLPCDILLAAHPTAIDMAARLPNLRADGACRRYADGARQRLEARLAEEKAARP